MYVQLSIMSYSNNYIYAMVVMLQSVSDGDNFFITQTV